MKKKVLLLPIIAGFAYMVFSSSSLGAGHGSGYNCTGAETGLTNPTGCYANSSCHSSSATTGITVVLELDSAGVATTHYKAGLTYTVKITGTNTTANNLPKFGFQVACIKGSAPVVTPVNAGTFASTGLPANVRYTSAGMYFVCNLIEHSALLSPSSGSGSTGTVYSESFPWTAPVTGTGTISFWGALNAVNSDNFATAADKWNTTHLIINEWPQPSSVHSVSKTFNITAFPNPVTRTLNLECNNAPNGSYALHVFDIMGKCVINENIEVGSSNHSANINTDNWAPGLYQLSIEKEGYYQVIPVIKR